MCVTMESRQLVVFSCVLVCVGLSDAGLGTMRLPGYWGGVMQVPTAVDRKPAAGPERERFSLFPVSANRFHSKWLQSAGDKFKWRFPEAPTAAATKPPVQLSAQQPVASNRVAVRCGESRIQVEVSQDLLGLGKLIDPDEISLGGCPPVELDPVSHVLIFESELHDCGSTLETNESGFVYAFKLVYDPRALGQSPITRSQRTVVGVECHYMN